jgi:DNA replication protein DnaC
MYNLAELAPSVRAQIKAAKLPMKTIGWELSDIDNSEAVEMVKIWLKSVEDGKVIQAAGKATCGKGLLLLGKPGHGKTTIASTALQSLIRTLSPEEWGSVEIAPRRPGLFMDYPQLLRLQKAQWSDFNDTNETMINGIYGESSRENIVRTFVLDDLGKEHRTSSGWAENVFDELLRARFNAGLPTIVTSNIPLQSWETAYGPAMASFAYEAFIAIEVNSGKDLRK